MLTLLLLISPKYFSILLPQVTEHSTTVKIPVSSVLFFSYKFLIHNLTLSILATIIYKMSCYTFIIGWLLLGLPFMQIKLYIL